MAFTVFLTLSLACGGAALTMLAADTSPWVRQHEWLRLLLMWGFLGFGLLAIAFTNRMRKALGGASLASLQTAGPNTTTQQTAGAFSPATTIGSPGGSVAVHNTYNVTHPGVSPLPTADPGTNQKPEIRVEIVEGFFNRGAFECTSGAGPACSDFLITLCLRLVNTRSQRTSVTNYELLIESQGGSFQLLAERLVLPHPHAIERDTVFHRGRGIERKAVHDIPDLDMSAPLECGVAVVGLVQFLIRDLEVAKLKNDAFQDQAKFAVRLTDSFLQTHEVTRMPDPWPKTGRLVPAP